MKSDFGINNKSNMPDDIDRLFELLDDDTPAPGYAFGDTLEMIRTGHLPAAPVTPTARPGFPLIGLVTAAAILVLVMTFAIFNSNGLSGSSKEPVVIATISSENQEQHNGEISTGVGATITSVNLAATSSSSIVKVDRRLQRLLDLEEISNGATVPDVKTMVDQIKNNNSKLPDHSSPSSNRVF
jgi:hypothetical protein